MTRREDGGSALVAGSLFAGVREGVRSVGLLPLLAVGVVAMAVEGVHAPGWAMGVLRLIGSYLQRFPMNSELAAGRTKRQWGLAASSWLCVRSWTFGLMIYFEM